jgi:hypothetical protein
MKSMRRVSRKLYRANWWFQQMREVVDKAVDWQPKKHSINSDLNSTPCPSTNKPENT